MAAERLKETNAKPFKDAAEEYIKLQAPKWRNRRKSENQYRRSLEIHIYPVFGHLPVAAINKELVKRALAPIWLTKKETARRLLARIENILDWAETEGYREEGKNPARWDGHMEFILGPQNHRRQGRSSRSRRTRRSSVKGIP